MITATRIQAALPQFAPTTNLYQCEDGKYLLVTVDTAGDDIGNSVPILSLIPVKSSVPADTVVFLADERGQVVDADGDPTNGLTPVLRCPGGTAAEEALQRMGYEVTDDRSPDVVVS